MVGILNPPPPTERRRPNCRPYTFKVGILTPPPQARAVDLTAAPIPKQPQNPNSDQTTSEYTASNCGAYHIGSNSGDKNILGAAAAAAQGFDVIAQRFDPQPISPSLT
jgi:hypothetical protein